MRFSRNVVAVSVSAIFLAVSALAADDSTVDIQDGAPAGIILREKAHSPLHLAVLRVGELPFDPPEDNLLAAAAPDARCRQSSLTQEKFLKIVHAIIDHRDMADKDFIEKILQIKFRSRNTAYSHVPGGGFYKGNMPDDMSDAPISVLFGIGTVSSNDASKSEVSSGISFSDLNKVSAVFHNCQYLTRKQLDPKSEAIVHHYDTIREFDPELNRVVTRKVKEHSLDASWDLGKVAKNGSDFEIRYRFKADGSDAIERVEINQKSETTLNPRGENSAGH